MDGRQEQWVGAAVARKEDHRFLTGSACFTDDIAVEGQSHAVVVRSPHAHARIGRIDAEAARAAPGVLLVLTAADVKDEIKKPIPSLSRTPPFDVAGREGGPAADASQYPLASDRVRYVGDPVAFVVAETLDQAHDAAALVAVDYEPLPAVVDFDQALAADAPRLWDELRDNVSFDWERGDADAVAKAIDEAAHVTRLDLVSNRVMISFMEPRSAVAMPDDGTGRLALHLGCQSAHSMQAVLADMLGLEPRDLRVVVPDTGGGFGARGLVYPEFPLALVAARRLGRPVKWTAERAEGFLADTQARDHVMRGELALDADGRFTALRVSIDWRHGAYLASRNIWLMVRFLPPTLGGVYCIPAAHVALRGVFSNTAPQSAYRGVGRMESIYLIESLVDAAARETGIDRVELRRRNLVTPDLMPWRAAGGNVYTSGDFGHNLERALEIADWAGFDARRRAEEGKGLLHGIGLAMYVENDGGVPQEYAEVAAGADGRVTVAVGTQDFGMGHETLYSQIVADALGVPFERVRVVFGDTDRVARGAGAHGSRSARIGGGAAVLGAEKMIEAGTELAAEMLESARADIEYRAGFFTIVGTDRTADLAEVAAFAAARGRRLAGDADFVTAAEAHATGCHVCEVTVDPEDGSVRIERYAVVADVGRAINSLIVHGQMHGGAVQGIGQALLERVVYDRATGQPLAGSYMDYCIPRADDLPPLAVALEPVIEGDNPLGVKGAGESATTGAPGAVMNAIRDALAQAGVRHLDMPATPERVWRALAAIRTNG